MKDWRTFISDGNLNAGSARAYQVYPNSIAEVDGTTVFLASENRGKRLVAVGEGSLFAALDGNIEDLSGRVVKVCPLSADNASVIREFFPYAKPRALGKEGVSMGLGDRLGIASPGHIRVIQELDVQPILAQQSMRELKLTNRTYQDVLDAASWAVLQEGYTKGFGADGDHLKTIEEIRGALSLGYTMITLDCSEHIDNSLLEATDQEITAGYDQLPAEAKGLEEKLLGQQFDLGDGMFVAFTNPIEYKRMVLLYWPTISYTEHVHDVTIATNPEKVDFEVSIDETASTTSPEAHFFVASELARRGVDVNSLAPRFVGEFQKGIDYIGDIDDFTADFRVHAAIAKHFGYKLSIHSGSDKFTAFPTIGRYTNGKVHVKTAGTNWLEALRIVAMFEPELFREVFTFALEHFAEATAYYHVKAKPEAITPLAELEDTDLPGLLDQDDSRQVLHITYGLILNDQKLAAQLFKVWAEREEEYAQALQRHIGRHFAKLGVS